MLLYAAVQNMLSACAKKQWLGVLDGSACAWPVKGLFCPDGLDIKTWRSVLHDDSDADDEVIGEE